MNPLEIRITRILIVDGNILFREGLASLLNGLPDFAVVGQVGRVQQALENAIELKPDVILMDVLFPDGSGINAIRPILDILPQTKIVILTMADSDEYLFSALRCGAKGYILQNTPIDTLLASIRALARGEAAISRSHIIRVLDEFSRLNTNGHASELISSTLTKRELEVIKELVLGSSNREIAHHLSITENTVKRHIHSILNKLGFRSRREVAKYALKRV